MRNLSSIVVVGATLLLAPRAVAAGDPPAGRFEFAASLGYAAPLGDSERGGRVRDTTFGAVPVALDAAYRLAPRLGISAHLEYGVGIPTLCRTVRDCESSLGRDVVAVLAARIYLPRLGRLAPVADAGLGYEWFATGLSDSGAHSRRAFDGPILLSAWLAAPFRVGAHWTLGPIVGMTLGTFTAYALETNVGSISGNVPARAVHMWMLLGVRLSLLL